MSMPVERSETLAMVWPLAGAVPEGQEAGVRSGVDRAAFCRVQSAAGWTVTDTQWAQLTHDLVEESMVVVHAPHAVAAACALHRPHGWVELAWVAVAQGHRGRGLGARVCASVVRRLLARGHTRVFGSTQDHRLAALHIYLRLGFVPVQRPDRHARWQAVCRALGWPYTPDVWGWSVAEPGAGLP